MRAPVPWATAALVLIGAIALPVLGGSLTTPDARSLPESASARSVAERIEADFPQAGATSLGVVDAARHGYPSGRRAPPAAGTGGRGRTPLRAQRRVPTST